MKFKTFKTLFKTCFLDVFNYEKPPDGNPFFSDEVEGMTCACLPECNRVDYAIEISPNVLSWETFELDETTKYHKQLLITEMATT